jgi:hypothetical protein
MEPRMPCYKLGLRFGRDDNVKRFLASGLTGLYVAVEHEGEVEAGEPFTLFSREKHGLTVADITRVYVYENAMSTRFNAWCNSPTCLPPGGTIFKSNCANVGSSAEGDDHGCDGATGVHYHLVPRSRDIGPPQVLVEDWEANHACCCALHLERAAQGDTKTFNTIRSPLTPTLNEFLGRWTIPSDTTQAATPLIYRY